MDNVREEIAKNILYYRKSKKYTQKELAEYLGVGVSAVSNWEKGVNSVDIDTLHKVCVFLQISINDIFGSFSNITSNALTPYQQAVINNMKELNIEGQEKLVDYSDDLVSSGKYKKLNSDSVGAEKSTKHA